MNLSTNIRCMGDHDRFPLFVWKEKTFVTSYLFLWHETFPKGYTVDRKNFVGEEQILCFEFIHLEKKDKMKTA